jgi:hypothetical protein
MSPTKADAFFGQPDQARGGRVAADKDQLDAAVAIEQRGALGEGQVRRDDDDVVELRLDLRFALEAVAHPLLEVFGVARHLLVRAFVGQHLDRHEVLVAQRVAAVMIGVDQQQKRLARILLLDLRAPIDRLRRDQRRIDQHDALLGVDEAGRTAPVKCVDEHPGRQFLPLSQPRHADSHCTASTRHVSTLSLRPPVSSSMT